MAISSMTQAAAGRRRRWFSARARLITLFCILVLPALALRLFTAVWPIIATIDWSFRRVDAMGAGNYVGFANYSRFLGDQVMTASFGFTFWYVIASTILQICLGLLVSLLLNAAFKGRAIARSINLIPWAVPLIVAAMGFRWLLDDQYGLINDLLIRVGLPPVHWLIQADTARLGVIAANVWRNTPFIAMIFLAGLQGIPQDLYEAAQLDGAGPVQLFRYVTLPLVLPLVITMSMFFAIWQLASFDLIYGMTQGGPGFATSVLAWQIYKQAFQAFNFGYASAISVVLLLVIALFGAFGYMLFRTRQV
jgi:multiple sugar transport system permease protein